MKYACIRKNFFGGRLWRVGDVAEFAPDVAGAPSVVAHFRKDAPAPVVAAEPAPSKQDDLALDGATAAAAEDGGEDGSALRENLKALCQRHGVEIRPRMGVRQMRAALEAIGVQVS